MTLSDSTGIAHSEMKPDGSVKVYIEKPINEGFKHITCYLPDFKWMDNKGFTSDELKNLRTIVENNTSSILEHASSK